MQAAKTNAEEASDFTDYPGIFQTLDVRDNIHHRLEMVTKQKGDALVPLLLYGHLKSKGIIEEKYKTINSRRYSKHSRE